VSPVLRLVVARGPLAERGLVVAGRQRLLGAGRPVGGTAQAAVAGGQQVRDDQRVHADRQGDKAEPDVGHVLRQLVQVVRHAQQPVELAQQRR